MAIKYDGIPDSGGYVMGGKQATQTATPKQTQPQQQSLKDWSAQHYEPIKYDGIADSGGYIMGISGSHNNAPTDINPFTGKNYDPGGYSLGQLQIDRDNGTAKQANGLFQAKPQGMNEDFLKMMEEMKAGFASQFQGLQGMYDGRMSALEKLLADMQNKPATTPGVGGGTPLLPVDKGTANPTGNYNDAIGRYLSSMWGDNVKNNDLQDVVNLWGEDKQ